MLLANNINCDNKHLLGCAMACALETSIKKSLVVCKQFVYLCDYRSRYVALPLEGRFAILYNTDRVEKLWSFSLQLNSLRLLNQT